MRGEWRALLLISAECGSLRSEDQSGKVVIVEDRSVPGDL